MADETVELLIVPLRDAVLFPGVVLPIAVNRPRTTAAAQEAMRTRSRIGFLLQRSSAVEDPQPDDLYRVGTVASIVRFVTAPDGVHHLICQGEQRFEVEARGLYLRDRAIEALQLLPQTPAELVSTIQAVKAPGQLADLVISVTDADATDKQGILETLDLTARLDKVIGALSKRIEVLKLSRDIGEKTREALNERQKEAVLREQLRQIRRELGEEPEGPSVEMRELKEAIERAGMPEEAREQALRELQRLERMPEGSGEHSMVRTYLDWLVALPWSKLDPESLDIESARRVLDADHFGLEKVKRRILEFLAVRKLNPQGRSPILCFVGPPGVGKTSLGQSIARALGLKFVRVSLGGVHDEAEIRGHRRTYLGSLPGNIIQALRRAGTRNPVLMLDEVDKLSASIQGDPYSALLEVLDPEQNSTFRDNYIGLPFDLSRVLFICTANVLDAIPTPLRDRMELIELTGYTEEEKLEIARRYLAPRQLAANGLAASAPQLSDEVLRRIIADYTRESGVRSLERQIGAVLRSVAVGVASGHEEPVAITADDVPRILGAPRYQGEIAMRTSVPGVATGLAWTPVGGDILFIESSRVPGSGRLILTGQLGDVMKESAQAAVTLVKGQAERLGVDPGGFDKIDLHIHVPAGAIPKDGPSAGVAIFTSLASLLSGKTVRSDVAMTGEISLRGLVLPVGGIKEKTVAAARAGIRTVILPARNRRDYDEIPESARQRLQFIWAERIDEVLSAALEGAGARRAAAA